MSRRWRVDPPAGSASAGKSPGRARGLTRSEDAVGAQHCRRRIERIWRSAASRRCAWLGRLALAALAAAALGCDGGGAGRADGGRATSGQLTVFVDSYPLSYFAQRVGGDRVAVSFPIPSGVDPQFWTPDANLIARYQAADLILVNGAGYAAWVDTATLPGSRLVDTSSGFTDRLLPLENAVTHSHGGMGEHSHTGYATMPWLDPMLAIEQASAIAAAFTAARPEGDAAFADGLAALRRDFEALDARLAAVAGRIGSTPLVFSHPIYSYLARRYGLSGRSVHWDPAEVPGYFALAQLDEKLAGHAAQWMLWEAEPLAETTAELERRGIRSLVFDPLAGAPASGDYLSVMGDNVARLEAAFPGT